MIKQTDWHTDWTRTSSRLHKVHVTCDNRRHSATFSGWACCGDQGNDQVYVCTAYWQTDGAHFQLATTSDCDILRQCSTFIDLQSFQCMDILEAREMTKCALQTGRQTERTSSWLQKMTVTCDNVPHSYIFSDSSAWTAYRRQGK